MKKLLIFAVLACLFIPGVYADDWTWMGHGVQPRVRDVITEIRSSTPVVTGAAAGDTVTVAIGDLGKLFVFDTIADMSKRTLPAAVAGREVTFYVSDSDSLIITTAASDTLLSGANLYKTTTSVAGVIKLHAVDSKFWIFEYSSGTWSSY